MADRSTASRQRPVYVERPSQVRQNRTVRLNIASTEAGLTGGELSRPGADSNTAPATSPAFAVHLARTSLPCGSSGTVERSARSRPWLRNSTPLSVAVSSCGARP